MIIDDLNIERVATHPAETQSPLVIDPNAVLTHSVANEFFKLVSGRHGQVFDPDRGIQLSQLSESHALDICTKPPDWESIEEPFSLFVCKAPDHRWIITRYVIIVKQSTTFSAILSAYSPVLWETQPDS